jgi:hypothetical protein
MVAFPGTTAHGEQSYTPSAETGASMKVWERIAKISPRGVLGEEEYYSPYLHFIRKAKGAQVCDVGRNDYWNAGSCELGHSRGAKTSRNLIVESAGSYHGWN